MTAPTVRPSRQTHTVTTTPLLLLDVDGVLNAFDDVGGWDVLMHGYARAEGNRWPILYSPTVIARLLALHTAGQVEIQWLTTWGHDANGGLRELLGMPELVVAGTYAGDNGGEYADTHVGALAEVTASAPDHLTGEWWKFDIVRRIHDADPDRPLIWVDDELHHSHNPYSAWAADHDHLAVGPDPRTGLTEKDLLAIEEFCETRRP